MQESRSVSLTRYQGGGLRHEAREAAPGPATDPRTTAPARPLPWLLAVAGAFTLAQLALAVPGVGLGWDETVYVSQISPQAPAAFFSAPRARGITFLVAPVAAWTTSTEALRVYLALLSGCGLFAALWVWRRLLPAPVLAVAGALFASLWVTVFYGPQAMPNLWVALGALAAVGCFLRAARDPGDHRALIGLGAGMALAALMRPTDAVWLALPLAGAALSVPNSRRTLLLAVLVGSAVLGCAEWVVEAYAAYGGLGARLARASEIQGHLGWYFAVDDHARALGGRTLCRPCDGSLSHPVSALWFLALPLIVTGGVRAAARTGRRGPVLLAAAVGATLAVPYLFTVGYAAPRFLLPAYALLAVPTAYGLVRALAQPRRWRPAVVALLAGCLAVHLVTQYLVLDGVTGRARATAAANSRVAAVLRTHGVRPPCVLTGDDAIRVAFLTGCASRQPTGHDAGITPGALAEAGVRRPVVVLLSGGQGIPSYARSWRPLDLPDPPARPGYRAYVSPAAGSNPLAPVAGPAH
ncbi:hypothetical protein OG787_08890 [Streptomyces sp. NBC_00075]|uniref:hypothetical protein n=1 Tax=Streptomyces sp. NBC_00075 TaxID=2975641 RepID=UPI00325121FB